MKKGLFTTLLILGISLFILSCQLDMAGNSEVLDVQRADDAGPMPKIIKDTGIIRYINLEGGFYGIIGRNGNYDPVNLPRVFMQDGLAVEFTAEVLNTYSIHMWGIPVRLISMVTTASEKKLVLDEGVIHQKFIQGMPWIIEASTGSYQPINLPNAYRIENLKVRFVAVIRDDIIIIPALWPIIEILEIEKIGGPILVDLGVRFKLPEGESAYVQRERVLLTFKEVLSDSRCPIGAMCFWEGEAVILVNVTIGGRNYGDFKMTTRNKPSIIYVGRYYVQFIDLLPYPVLDPDSNKPVDYVGEFLINYASIPPSI